MYEKNASPLLVVVVAVIAVVAVGIIIVVLVFFYYHFLIVNLFSHVSQLTELSSIRDCTQVGFM